MKTNIEQYTSEFGESVVHIPANSNYPFNLTGIIVDKNQSVILTGNVDIEYSVNSTVYMDILRNGKTIINGKQIMTTNSNINNPASTINFTYNLSIVDQINALAKDTYDYTFVIYTDINQPLLDLIVLRAIFSAKVINNCLLSVAQLIPVNGGSSIYLGIQPPNPPNLPLPTTLSVNIPQPYDNCYDNCDRIIDVTFGLYLYGTSYAQLEIINPDGVSLTNGPQTVTTITGANMNVVNVNFSVVDDLIIKNKNGNYVVNITNAAIKKFPIMIVNYYSFNVQLIDSKNITVVKPKNIDGPITIPQYGKYQYELNVKNMCKKINELKLVMNLSSNSMPGSYNLFTNIKKNGKSISYNPYPLLSLFENMNSNCELLFYDYNENDCEVDESNNYTIELLNNGVGPLSIDYYNLTDTKSTGKYKEILKNTIVPVLTPSTTGTNPNVGTPLHNTYTISYVSDDLSFYNSNDSYATFYDAKYNRKVLMNGMAGGATLATLYVADVVGIDNQVGMTINLMGDLYDNQHQFKKGSLQIIVSYYIDNSYSSQPWHPGIHVQKYIADQWYYDDPYDNNSTGNQGTYTYNTNIDSSILIFEVMPYINNYNGAYNGSNQNFTIDITFTPSV